MRFLMILILFIVMFIGMFSVLPVPFSAVMVERQISAMIKGDFSYRSHSIWVDEKDISPNLSLAIIAGEDQHFPEHWGFDLSAIRNVLGNTSNLSTVRGASTISQQTAKNMFLWEGRSWLRKGLEAGFTLAIEAIWGKKRILTIYMNIAEFGPGVFGAEAAARYYFHKSARQLTSQEAAVLAAILPSPLRFRVNNPSNYVLQRQSWILKQMHQLGGTAFLSQHHLKQK